MKIGEILKKFFTQNIVLKLVAIVLAFVVVILIHSIAA